MLADHAPSPPEDSCAAASGHPPTDYDIEELHELLTNIERDLLSTEIPEVHVVLSHILGNIVQNPSVSRFRTLLKSNDQVANDVTKHPSVVEVLKAVGFQESEEEYFCPENTNLQNMLEAVHELRSIMITHGEQVAGKLTDKVSIYGRSLRKSPTDDATAGKSASEIPSIHRMGTKDCPMASKSALEMHRYCSETTTYNTYLKKLSRRFRHTPTVWQWEHRTGYKTFDRGSCARIEEAFMNGDSKVLLKTGKVGITPMEIFFEDMIQFDPVSKKKRQIRRNGHTGLSYHITIFLNGTLRFIETGRWRRETFAEYDARRMELRQRSNKYINMSKATSLNASLKSSSPRTVQSSSDHDLYKQEGIFATIMQSHVFLAAQITAILLNAVWLWMQADLEVELNLKRGAEHVIAIENVFCVFFVGELLVRYGAFREWWLLIYDRWFMFDFILVLLMVGETWILPLYLEIASAASNGNALEDLSVLRTMRLFRLTRLVHVLHAVPEVLMLLRGLSSAMHSVLFTVLLLMVILFAFGIVFKSQTEDYAEIQSYYFATVPEAMLSLLVHATLLDSPSSLARELKDQAGAFLVLVFLFFLFITAFAVLGVLIGILCEVVAKVSEAEREEAEVSYLQNNLLGILDVYDRDGRERLGREEFNMFMQNPEVHDVLRKFGTDPQGLEMLQDVLFPDHSNEVSHTAGDGDQLSFEDFFEIVMRLRGGKAASVTDLVGLRLYVRKRHDELAAFLMNGVEATPSKTGSVGSNRDTLGKVLACLDKLTDNVDRLRTEMSVVRQEIRGRVGTASLEKAEHTTASM